MAHYCLSDQSLVIEKSGKKRVWVSKVGKSKHVRWPEPQKIKPRATDETGTRYPDPMPCVYMYV